MCRAQGLDGTSFYITVIKISDLDIRICPVMTRCGYVIVLNFESASV